MNENKNYQKIGNKIALIIGCILILFSIILLLIMAKDMKRYEEMKAYSESLQEEIENYK